MDKKQLSCALIAQLDYLTDIVKGDTYGSGLKGDKEQEDALGQIELIKCGVEKLSTSPSTDDGDSLRKENENLRDLIRKVVKTSCEDSSVSVGGKCKGNDHCVYKQCIKALKGVANG